MITNVQKIYLSVLWPSKIIKMINYHQMINYLKSIFNSLKFVFFFKIMKMLKKSMIVIKMLDLFYRFVKKLNLWVWTRLTLNALIIQINGNSTITVKWKEKQSYPFSRDRRGIKPHPLHWVASIKKCFNPCLYTQIYIKKYFVFWLKGQN